MDIRDAISKVIQGEDEREWALLQVLEDTEGMDEKEFNSYKNNVIKKGRLCWNHSAYEKMMKKEREYDTYTQTPPEVEEGVLQCKKCKSKKVLSFQVQSRSADEPMTTVAKCSQCGIGWTENN